MNDQQQQQWAQAIENARTQGAAQAQLSTRLGRDPKGCLHCARIGFAAAA